MASGEDQGEKRVNFIFFKSDKVLQTYSFVNKLSL